MKKDTLNWKEDSVSLKYFLKMARKGCSLTISITSAAVIIWDFAS